MHESPRCSYRRCNDTGPPRSRGMAPHRRSFRTLAMETAGWPLPDPPVACDKALQFRLRALLPTLLMPSVGWDARIPMHELTTFVVMGG
jgi:hypothetical protein